MSDRKPKVLEVQKGDMAGAVNAFLSDLLEKGRVAAVLAPRVVASGEIAFPALVSDPGKIKADPFAPVLSVATAQVVSTLTREGPLSHPVAVVMRNCQIRALIELAKLKQAELDNIVIVGIDCPGTIAINDYKAISRERSSSELYQSLLKEDKELMEKVRSACLACVDPIPEKCDILIGIFGLDPAKEILVAAQSEKGEKTLDGMDLKDMKNGAGREAAVQKIKEKRIAAEKKFKEKFAGIKGIEAVLDFYATCINCRNCRRVCPICYCRECFFDSDNLAQSANDLVSKSRAKGAFKMPLDTLLFHTGRMNHMILSCVECGLCEQACPTGIPLMQVLKRVASDAQEKFNYRPGRNIEEEIPLALFREDEFTDMGEE